MISISGRVARVASILRIAVVCGIISLKVRAIQRPPSFDVTWVAGTLLVCDRKNRRNWLLSQSCRAGSLGKAERLDCALAGRTSFNRERQEVHLFRPVNACSSRVSSDQARVTGDDRLRCDR